MPDPAPPIERPSIERSPRRLIQDPASVPLDVAFEAAERGFSVPISRLMPAALRARLAAPPAWHPELTGDDKLPLLAAAPRSASVLIPLVKRERDVSVLLTRRTSHLHDHAGQISFPGGRSDAGDRDAVDTALREAREEIGLAPATVDVIGALPQYITITGYRVTPIVGLIEREPNLEIDEFEVEEAFEVPLAFLMNPANHQRHRYEWDGQSRCFYAMPYADGRGHHYFIWGATAAILRNFYHLLSA